MNRPLVCWEIPISRTGLASDALAMRNRVSTASFAQNFVNEGFPHLTLPRSPHHCSFEIPPSEIAAIQFRGSFLIVNYLHLNIRKATTNGTTSHASRIATGVTR